MSINVVCKYTARDFSVSNPAQLADNEICLDTGKSFVKGVIDHHDVEIHRAEYRNLTSTLSMLVQLFEWDRSTQEPWPGAGKTLSKIDFIKNNESRAYLLLHRVPDLDSILSAYLLESYWNGDFKKVQKRMLSDKSIKVIVEDSDRGIYADDSFRYIGNIYYVMEIIKELVRRNARIHASTSEELWDLWRIKLYEFLNKFIMDENYRDFSAYCQDYMRDRHELSENIQYIKRYYKASIENSPEVRVPVYKRINGRLTIAEAPISFFCMNNDIAPVFNIMKVQMRRPDDSALWVVYVPPELNDSRNKHRFVISVDGSLKFTLFSLGWHLERIERECREKLSKIDKIGERYPVRLGENRDGYDGHDPWYDGRDKYYTIVDCPETGTVLPEVNKELAAKKRCNIRIGDYENFKIHEQTLAYYRDSIMGHISIENQRWKLSMVEGLNAFISRELKESTDDDDHLILMAELVSATYEFIKGNPKIEKKLIQTIDFASLKNEIFDKKMKGILS